MIQSWFFTPKIKSQQNEKINKDRVFVRNLARGKNPPHRREKPQGTQPISLRKTQGLIQDSIDTFLHHNISLIKYSCLVEHVLFTFSSMNTDSRRLMIFLTSEAYTKFHDE